MPVDLPPTAFSNAMNNLFPDGYSFENWRQSNYWKIYLAGYQQAHSDCIDAINTGMAAAKHRKGHV